MRLKTSIHFNSFGKFISESSCLSEYLSQQLNAFTIKDALEIQLPKLFFQKQCMLHYEKVWEVNFRKLFQVYVLGFIHLFNLTWNFHESSTGVFKLCIMLFLYRKPT
jgi:hypothetical protein